MRLLHIVAARPNFIKAAPVLEELSKVGIENILVHTNQHYDYKMSKIFFQELEIPEPDYHLGIKSGTHGVQTGTALIEIEKVLLQEKPDGIVVYGDVNSTLSGALAAAKLHIPVIHVEAGQRSGDKLMPEELNRIAVDHFSSKLYCVEPSAISYLEREGLTTGKVVGNTAVDTLHKIIPTLKEKSIIGGYYIATLHRPFNVDNPDTLEVILDRLELFDRKVIIPAHPRLEQNIRKKYSNIQFIQPLGYIDFISYLYNSSGIVSDSGGVQCEASVLGIPLITLRPSTEHKLTLEYSNILVEDSSTLEPSQFKTDFSSELPWIWDGKASERIAQDIINEG